MDKNNPTLNDLKEKEKVHGFFLVEDINLVKEKKGIKGLEALQKLVPDLNVKKISPMRKYPLVQEIEILRGVAIVVYGGDTPEAWKQLGFHEFDTVKNSALGKILLSLFGNNFSSIIKNGGRIFEVFAPFVKYSYEILEPCRATVTIENDPYPKEYYLGSLIVLKDIFNPNGTVTAEETGNKKHIYRFIPRD